MISVETVIVDSGFPYEFPRFLGPRPPALSRGWVENAVFPR